MKKATIKKSTETTRIDYSREGRGSRKSRKTAWMVWRNLKCQSCLGSTILRPIHRGDNAICNDRLLS